MNRPAYKPLYLSAERSRAELSAELTEVRCKLWDTETALKVKHETLEYVAKQRDAANKRAMQNALLALGAFLSLALSVFLNLRQLTS